MVAYSKAVWEGRAEHVWLGLWFERSVVGGV